MMKILYGQDSYMWAKKNGLSSLNIDSLQFFLDKYHPRLRFKTYNELSNKIKSEYDDFDDQLFDSGIHRYYLDDEDISFAEYLKEIPEKYIYSVLDTIHSGIDQKKIVNLAFKQLIENPYPIHLDDLYYSSILEDEHYIYSMCLQLIKEQKLVGFPVEKYAEGFDDYLKNGNLIFSLRTPLNKYYDFSELNEETKDLLLEDGLQTLEENILDCLIA